MQLYGDPQLSEDEGIERISLNLRQSLDFLYTALSNHPAHSKKISRLINMVERACDIYLHRALNDVSPEMTVSIVEEFRAVAETLPANGEGEHILVWAYFIAAAESSTLEHRLFFMKKLQALYVSTGFANNLSALNLLKIIWAKHSETRWTYCMGNSSQSFVM